jgi:LDH2 family malate/lactate/ureidoglycolate dehydrogenase
MSKDRFHDEHYNFEMDMVISYDVMLAWVTKIFVALGMTQEDAALVADTLVVSDCRGVYSHGIMRVSLYGKRILAGGTNAKTKIDILKDEGATTLIDGNNSMGQPVNCFAMKHAMKKAKKYGSVTVSIMGSNHSGAIAYYPMMAIAEDMIAFCVSVAGGNVFAPWGGTDPRLGHSPFSYMIPAGKYDPIVFDMALSVVANGKVMLARQHGVPIPDTWGFDKYGRPSTNADDVYHGSLAPIGGYKGYGLSLGLELIASALPGAAFGKTQGDYYRLPGVPQNLGQFIHVVDIKAITDVAAFKKRIDDGIDYLKESPPAVGVTKILYPGEPEWKCYHKQKAEGIKYSHVSIQELRDFGKYVGVEPMA